MDDILAKHLAKTLLFKENKFNKNQYNYKLIDGVYYINNGTDFLISEKIGSWKNKDVVKVNEKNYIIMESSQTMIPLDHISKEDFKKYFKKDSKIHSKKIKTEKTFENFQTTNIVEKEQKENKKQEFNKEEQDFNKKEEIFTTDEYLSDIKTKNFEEDAEENTEKTEEDKFFDILEKKKDDPRVKRFFNYHADHMKKEFNQIIEKVKSSQFARAMESGGGTNAVQYANGGVMDGDLTVTKTIVSENITDTVGRKLVNKKTFDIVGNGSNNTFTLTHNFSSKDILINVYDSVNYQLVFVSSTNIDNNNTQISFPNNLDVGQNYRVILFS